ncbi:hypothetical protein GCM10009737_08110 [Nocardioides lentus]|uniref:HNH endonuclease n=1 Tax=Nocardioides lentus TaxID=338077 RepID=A0ABP5ACC2_9ACTN
MKRGGPLQRRTPLHAVTGLQRSAPAPRLGRARVRPRDTGPGASTQALVLDRAAGCCELCGRRLHDGDAWTGPHSFHHRRPRRMGGSRAAATNSPANLLLLCGSATSPDGCHLHVEQQRAMALNQGWLLHDGHDPTEVDVLLAYTPPGHRTWLTDDGAVTVADGHNTWRLR